MHLCWIVVIALAVPVHTFAQEQPADWSKKTFSAPSDRVFQAALTSLSLLHHEVQDKDEESKTVRFRVGKSAFSWGYTMVLKVSVGESNTSEVSTEVYRLRGPGPNGKASLVASGKKEVQRLLQQIENELNKTTQP
jgi:hypothetical protein